MSGQLRRDVKCLQHLRVDGFHRLRKQLHNTDCTVGDADDRDDQVIEKHRPTDDEAEMRI